MTSIREEAEKYQPSKIKVISDLAEVSTELEILEELEVEFPYKYIQIDGERYKMPISVIANLKELLAANPKLSKFKVKKTGEGIKVKYLVIPLA